MWRGQELRGAAMQEHGSPAQQAEHSLALSPETLQTLRAAVTRHARGEAHDDELRHALSVLAHEAQVRHLRAEELIIALKSLWRALPEVQQATNRTEQNLLLGRLVSLCIEEYYGH
jgi:hypothetical protein